MIEVKSCPKIKITLIRYKLEDITGWSVKKTQIRETTWLYRSVPHAVISEIEEVETELNQELNFELLEQENKFICKDPEN